MDRLLHDRHYAKLCRVYKDVAERPCLGKGDEIGEESDSVEPLLSEGFTQVSQEPFFPAQPTFPHAEVSAHPGPFPAEERRGG